jgi:peroxiredoxin Q/BCP
MTEESKGKEIAIGSGDPAPGFCLDDQDGGQVCLGDLLGRWIVLYFYPRDNTSGCTKEAGDFSSAIGEFRSLGAEVLGVSPDSTESHKRFRDKHGIAVLLLSDPDHRVLLAYGAWGAKKMYGKEHQGVIRSTVVIDPAGNIARIWRRVRVKGHVAEVLEALISLASGREEGRERRRIPGGAGAEEKV